ncbi:MAG TPA: hypothetical protein VLI39_08675 [Sedimentisphaerales bacterium]|nr:hypothetical protein [Sedimentisphaerales bacterium]
MSGEASRRAVESSSGDAQPRLGLRDRMANARHQAVSRPEQPNVTTPPVVAARQQAERMEARHSDLNSRLADYRQRRSPSSADPSSPRQDWGRDSRDSHSRRPSHVHARYYDRPDLIRHDYRRTHTYYDSHFRLHHRIIWPHYHYPIYYRFGPRGCFRYVYPYYHRKYVFISLGGFWPSDYSYVRYYWYGWHPYVWYGYYPIAREVVADNTNYYTYNYYYQNTDGSYTSHPSVAPVENEVRAVDQSTWTDVRQKLDQQQAKEPAAQTAADMRFEEGVKSFETGDYRAAADKFGLAMRMSPEDAILPFAYAQSLFADGRYTESADILRVALSKVTPEKEGVFYPRGLYANDDVLYAQIEKLVDKMEQFENDADMQLLLGYHLLGTGETGYAREPLERASKDMQNTSAARVLLRLADKIETEARTPTEGGDAAEQSNPMSETQAAPSSDEQTPTGDAKLSNAPGIVVPQVPKEDPTPGAVEASPLAERKDPNAAAVLLPNGVDSSDKGSRPIRPGATVATSGLFRLGFAGWGRYLRADFAVFAGIVLLGSVGVYVQWRLPCRGRA